MQRLRTAYQDRQPASGASRGSTIIVATHDAGLASRAPRRLAMRDGAIVVSSLPEERAGVGAAAADNAGSAIS